jgi:hypothetical protein
VYFVRKNSPASFQLTCGKFENSLNLFVFFQILFRNYSQQGWELDGLSVSCLKKDFFLCFFTLPPYLLASYRNHVGASKINKRASFPILV